MISILKKKSVEEKFIKQITPGSIIYTKMVGSIGSNRVYISAYIGTERSFEINDIQCFVGNDIADIINDCTLVSITNITGFVNIEFSHNKGYTRWYPCVVELSIQFS